LEFDANAKQEPGELNTCVHPAGFTSIAGGSGSRGQSSRPAGRVLLPTIFYSPPEKFMIDGGF
jgi:hypothetical protein